MLDIKKLKYTVIDQSNVVGSEHYDLYCRVYDFWKDTWKTIFEKVGSPKAWTADDFHRQNFIPVITYEGEIVATHYYTVFNLNKPCVKDMRYFEILKTNDREWIEEKKINKLMSMEFLTVAKDWRKPNIGFSAAEVLVQLAAELVKEKNIDATMGIAVKAAGIDKMAEKLSYEKLSSGVKRGNLVCDIVAQVQSELRPHPEPYVQEVVEYLWASKVHTGIFEYQKDDQHKAA